jgi:hypothetical protein
MGPGSRHGIIRQMAFSVLAVWLRLMSPCSLGTCQCMALTSCTETMPLHCARMHGVRRSKACLPAAELGPAFARQLQHHRPKHALAVASQACRSWRPISWTRGGQQQRMTSRAGCALHAHPDSISAVAHTWARRAAWRMHPSPHGFSVCEAGRSAAHTMTPHSRFSMMQSLPRAVRGAARQCRTNVSPLSWVAPQLLALQLRPLRGREARAADLRQEAGRKELRHT